MLLSIKRHEVGEQEVRRLESLCIIETLLDMRVIPVRRLGGRAADIDIAIVIDRDHVAIVAQRVLVVGQALR